MDTVDAMVADQLIQLALQLAGLVGAVCGVAGYGLGRWRESRLSE